MFAKKNRENESGDHASAGAEVVQWSPDPKSRRRRVEAVLFFSAAPLSSRKISQLAGLEDGTQARTIIRELNQQYNEQNRSFQVKRSAGGFQLLTRPQFSKWLRRLEYIPAPFRLSGPAMETLAVVAYRQPIIKADIEAIRGVSCGEMLRQLLEKGLVRISGRSEELGRPYLYSTTRDFLVHFGLNSLANLPRADRLSGQGLPSWVDCDRSAEASPESVETDESE
ncbi:MAG: SMC-Scp complex subunit ScpB [Mariniblastus sp.]|nr:SMC-Scp complex subunit ScpB [Mariniblastus sp.]